MVAVTGAPYDTLEEVIGLRGEGNGSLRDFGVSYDQVDLLPDGTPDYDGIKKRSKEQNSLISSAAVDMRPVRR